MLPSPHPLGQARFSGEYSNFIGLGQALLQDCVTVEPRSITVPRSLQTYATPLAICHFLLVTFVRYDAGSNAFAIDGEAADQCTHRQFARVIPNHGNHGSCRPRPQQSALYPFGPGAAVLPCRLPRRESMGPFFHCRIRQWVRLSSNCRYRPASRKSHMGYFVDWCAE